MGYREALESVCTVHEFQEFGSYQGRCCALVTHNGQTGWVCDWYGSCSGCDAFQSEFGWSMAEEEGAPEYQEKLKAFALKYLDPLRTQSEAEAYAGEDRGWDESSTEMMDFIKAHPIELVAARGAGK